MTINRQPRIIGYSSLILAMILASMSVAANAADTSSVAHRPRICLVLGGGGARGGAHVGVLKVLEELRVPIDCVVGTSMGSIVGGLYASGMSAEQIAQQMRAMDWKDLFQDKPPRADLTFRRKTDDYIYAFGFKPGFNDFKLQFAPALIRGQKFDLTLNRLLLPVIDVKDFNKLPIPYRAVATDIETGKPVVLSSGNLTRSIHASMAVPAVFDPVEINGRLLIDGGISDNVPVNVARAMGADVVIVVDVGSGLFNRQQIKGVGSITAQLANYLFTLNTEQQLKSLGPQDVLIRPPLGDFGGSDFAHVTDTFAIGEQGALAESAELKRYSLSPQEYARYRAQHAPPPQRVPVIDAVRINNHSRVSDAVIADRISAKPGQPLDVDQLDQEIGQIYGLDIFQSVRYDLQREGDQDELVISDQDKSWGPGYLQFGLSSSNNLKGNSTFKAGVLYTRTELNELNGEWRLGLQLGDQPGISTELYQPLDPLGRYFASGLLGYGKTNENIFDSSGDLISRNQVDTFKLELATGREFGTWGQGRIGYRRESGDSTVTIGTPAPSTPVNNGEVFIGLSDDKLDNVNFPTSGHSGTLEVRFERGTLGSNTDYNQAVFGYLQPFTWGSNTLLYRIGAFSTFDGTAPLNTQVNLGGFLRLSGLQDNQLSGQYAGLITLAYMHRINDIQLFQAYAGASLERGNVWQHSTDISFGNSITAGSMFLGVDTPIGPLYLAYGMANNGEHSFYIYLGPRFTAF
ncbi:MAG: patatin-like phospholipase family protein [Gammaproteobacteria bacterium]